MSEAPAPLLSVKHLSQHYYLTRGQVFEEKAGSVQAIDDLSFDIAPGQVVAIAGEHGAGKSALARTVAMLDRPVSGQVEFEGHDLSRLSERQLRPIRRKLQMVFSDPRTALNPSATVAQLVIEPLAVHQIGAQTERRERAAEALRALGLNPCLMDRRITALSIAHRQRVALARALVLGPSLVICDDPTAALEPAARASLVNRLAGLGRARHIALLWLTSRPRLIRHIADWMIVLYRGRAVEAGRPQAIIDDPWHPHTCALLGQPMDGAPSSGEALRQASGVSPSTGSGQAPSKHQGEACRHGCRFHPDCPRAMQICRQAKPAMREVNPDQWVACYLYDNCSAHQRLEVAGNNSEADLRRLRPSPRRGTSLL